MRRLLLVLFLIVFIPISASGDTEITWGTPVNFNEGACYYIDMAYLDATHIVIAYQNQANDDGEAIIAVVSETTILSFGTAVAFDGDAIHIAVDALDSTHFVVSFRDNDGGDDVSCIVGTVSLGDTITFGDVYDVEWESTLIPSDITTIDADSFLVTWVDPADADTSAMIGVVTEDDVITFGTEYEYHSGTFYSVPTNTVLDTTHIVCCSISSLAAYNEMGTVANDDEITWVDDHQFHDDWWNFNDMCALDANTWVHVGEESDNDNIGAYIGSYSGSTVYDGAISDCGSDNDVRPIRVCKGADANHFFIAYHKLADDKAYVRYASRSGTTITWEGEVAFSDGTTSYVALTNYDEYYYAVTYYDSTGTQSELRLFSIGVSVGILWNGVIITKWNGIVITSPLNTQ